MKGKLLLLILLVAGNVQAQDSIFARFVFHNQGQPFQLNEVVTAQNGIDYSVESMAFYMSRVKLIHDGGQVTTLDTTEVFYVNFNAPMVHLGQFSITSLEAIRFDVGVPLELNHLDISQYPEGHPLSYQTPTMHWGWSAGYMLMVMNGFGDTDNNGTTTQTYQLNCLGDHNVQTTEVATEATIYPGNIQHIVVICNVDEWLRGSNPATTGAAHGDTGINETVMENIVNYPVFVSPANASLSEEEQLPVQVAQSGKEVTVTWGETHVNTYRMLNAEGKVLSRGKCEQQQLSLTNLEAGWHIVQLYSEKDVLLGTAKWIVP
jgi:hypothetical protein